MHEVGDQSFLDPVAHLLSHRHQDRHRLPPTALGELAEFVDRLAASRGRPAAWWRGSGASDSISPTVTPGPNRRSTLLSMPTRRASIRHSRKRCHAACAPNTSEIRNTAWSQRAVGMMSMNHGTYAPPDPDRRCRSSCARPTRWAVRSSSAARDSRARSPEIRARVS